MEPLHRSSLGLSFRLILSACLMALAVTTTAQAQMTEAQKAAMKSSCRSDYMSNCMSVKPGGIEALQCLQKNMSKLSPGCQAAVTAAMPPPAKTTAAPPPPKAAAAPPPPAPAVAAPKPTPAAAPQLTSAQKDAMRASCRGDYMSHCSSVPPGGPDSLACLKRNASQLSAACKHAIGATTVPPAQKPPKAAVRAAPPPAVAPVAEGPTPQQLKAIKFTCRNDFRTRCRGVPTGGQEAIACLMRNSARLTPNCRTSILAIQETVPMAPAIATSAAAAQPTPEQQAALKQNCRSDFPRVCPGVSPGPSALTCLQTHAAELSPACKASVASLGGAAGAAPAAAPAQARRLPPGITPVGRVLRRVMEHNR